ncbi:RusA family crossover junction endodeoxyribonuclease [Atlantibacter subterraneus]|uniref:RusA family crossover junction endodeoxyribonuclease n=1 Tax=Atlantibacter subterraneus TaxID=255519 RepID=UPI002FDC7AF5
MNEYRLTLPWPPSVNSYWRRRGSQYYISKKGQQYRKEVIQIIQSSNLDIQTESRLRIKVIAAVPDSRRRDLDNILKSLLDSLIHAGFAMDDEQFDDIRVIRGQKVRGGSLDIKITELEEVCLVNM